MVVVVGIIINVVFGIVVVFVVIVNCEDSTLSGRTTAVGIIIVRDKAKGPIIVGIAFFCSIRLASDGGTVIIRLRRMMIVAFEIIIDVVFGRIVIVVVVVVNCEDSTLSGRTPAVGIIIVGDKAKGPIIVGNRVLDTAVTIAV